MQKLISITKNEFEVNEIKCLLDGQQRLTSIMWALDMKKPAFHRGRELNFELMFNPVKQEFRRTIGKNTDNFEHWISVPEFFRKGMDSYIDKFYESYPNVKVFLEKTIKKCEETKYVETLF